MTSAAAQALVEAAGDRARLRELLERVDADLVRWREHEADRALPLEYKRYPPVPDTPREELEALHAAVVQELTRLA